MVQTEKSCYSSRKSFNITN